MNDLRLLTNVAKSECILLINNYFEQMHEQILYNKSTQYSRKPIHLCTNVILIEQAKSSSAKMGEPGITGRNRNG